MLTLAFAAVIAVVGAVAGPLMWMLTLVLVVVTVAVGVLYQRTLDGEAGDPRPGYLGFFLLIPSLGAILVRGTEAAAFASPLLAVAGGVLVWWGLRWCERSPWQALGSDDETKVPRRLDESP